MICHTTPTLHILLAVSWAKGGKVRPRVEIQRRWRWKEETVWWFDSVGQFYFMK